MQRFVDSIWEIIVIITFIISFIYYLNLSGVQFVSHKKTFFFPTILKY